MTQIQPDIGPIVSSPSVGADHERCLMCDRTSVGSRMPPDPDSSRHLLCEGQTGDTKGRVQDLFSSREDAG